MAAVDTVTSGTTTDGNVTENYSYTNIQPVDNQPGIYSATFDPDGANGREKPRTVYIVMNDNWRVSVYRFDTLEQAIEFNNFVSNKQSVVINGQSYSSGQALLAVNGEGVGTVVAPIGTSRFNHQVVNIGGVNGLQVRVLTPEGENLVSNYDNNEYFGEGIPALPPELQVYIDHPFDPTANTPVQFAVQLAGLQGAAQSVYNTAGYDKNPLPDVNNLDENTRQLIELVFGPGTKPNQGHLNVLKTLGLIQGSATKSPSTWTLTPAGEAILGAAPRGADGNIEFGRMFGGLNMATVISPSRFEEETDLSSFFEVKPDGTVALKEGVDITAIPAKLRGALGLISASVSPGPLPEGLKIPPEVKDLLTNIFGDTELTSSHLNVAIAAGLISCSGNEVTLTPQGKALAASINSGANQPTVTTPDNTPTVDQATYTNLTVLSNSRYKFVFDTGAGTADGQDNVVSKHDLEVLANWPDGEGYTYYTPADRYRGVASSKHVISADEMRKIKVAARWLLDQMNSGQIHPAFGPGFGFNGVAGDLWIGDFKGFQANIRTWTEANKPAPAAT